MSEDGPGALPPRAVLDTNVLVAAGFRPASASGRLAEAARSGRLVALWNEATYAEAERILGQIPPLSTFDLDGVLRPEGRVDVPLDLDPFAHLAGVLDQTLAALAAAASAPLVTADRPLAEGAPAAGVQVLQPAAAVQSLGL